MTRALIIGESGGIGGAVAAALRARGDEVTGLSRATHGLDLTDEATVRAHLAALDGPFELIFVATGALEIAGAVPEKSLDEIDPETLLGQYALNAVGPALLLKHGWRLLPREGRSVFAVLSARVGSIGDNRLGGWYGYRAAKAGLNQILHSAAIEINRRRREAIVAALHPGTVRTEFTRAYADRHPTVSPGEAARNLLAVMDGLTRAQSGGFYDWAGHEVPW
ncbi:SDR family NAD(P)-dependent oxidoreductase [Poseidonocella sedimentorum]|uniref:Short-chain dehydrogenase n=1 Tax=Poseidonocella sedimentorum TaxID=871652 RepID=A0A1I6DYD9_9RHOB|nr:SDR family NAD(P)-dependent oxidoreductase [Poseidonocella sedimentorum]SFR10397.1 Short-chain dehydrogenase [Poseidonocella sedimentorum]